MASTQRIPVFFIIIYLDRVSYDGVKLETYFKELQEHNSEAVIQEKIKLKHHPQEEYEQWRKNGYNALPREPWKPIRSIMEARQGYRLQQTNK